MGRLVLLKNIECPCCIGDPGHVFLAVCPQPRSGVFFQGFQQLVPPTWLIMELDLWWAGAGLYGLMRVDCFHIFPTVCSLRWHKLLGNWLREGIYTNNMVSVTNHDLFPLESPSWNIDHPNSRRDESKSIQDRGPPWRLRQGLEMLPEDGIVSSQNRLP